MTIQIPKIDSSDLRLASEPENATAKNLDRSFEEKLKYEQARLGLLFSPFAQLDAFFSAGSRNGSQTSADELNSLLALEPNDSSSGLYGKPANPAGSSAKSSSQPQIFDSIPLKSFNQQWMRDLFIQNNWLTPNLQAQPLFYQAFLDGKLQLNLDLQSLVDEIVSRVEMVKEKGKVEISLTLKPEELGEILLTLTAYAGIVSVEIRASSETKKILVSQRSELEQALKKANINFDKIIVEEVKANA